MPNWKKVAVSGSSPEFNNITASGHIDILGAGSSPITDGVRLGVSADKLAVHTDNGYVAIGPANASFSHFYTDRAKYYFNKHIVVDEGKVTSYNEDLTLRRIYNSTDNELTIGDNMMSMSQGGNVVFTMNAGNITSSGNISSSGIITATNFIADDATGYHFSGDNVRVIADTDGDNLSIQGGGLNAEGNITASGDISSSKTLIGKNISISNVSLPDTNDNATHYFPLFADGEALETTNGITFNPSTDTLLLGGNSIYLTATGGHITASGNISASGQVYGNILNAKTRVKAIDSTLEFSGDTLDFVDASSLSRLFKGTVNGAFEAYHAGVKKFETTSNGANITGNVTGSGNLKIDGSVIDFSNLPTSDPGVAGRLWNDSNTLKISAG